MSLPKPYYVEAGIVIYNADCRDVLPHLPKVDLVLTDPPYGTQDLGGGYGRRQLHSPDGRLGRVIANDRDLCAIMSAAAGLYGAMAEASWLVSFCAPRRMIETAQIFQLAGFEYFGHAVWDKGAPGLGYTVRYSHEDLLIFRKGNPPTPDEAVMSIVRVGVSRIETATRHPHEKPAEVWGQMARLCPGTILDPFMGTGASLIAAKRLGRAGIGIEIDPAYCERAVDRLRQDVLPMGPEPQPEQDDLFGTGLHRMSDAELAVLGEQDHCREMALETDGTEARD